MSVLGQSPSIWCDVEAVVEDRDNCRMESDSSKIHAIMLAADKRETRNRDSGCDLSSAGTDSPSSYRWIKDDNSTGSYSCSSCEATVDQTSVVYQQLAETLAQARLNNSDSKETLDMPSSSMVVSESLMALNPIRPDDFKMEDNSMSMDYPDEKKQWLPDSNVPRFFIQNGNRKSQKSWKTFPSGFGFASPGHSSFDRGILFWLYISCLSFHDTSQQFYSRKRPTG